MNSRISSFIKPVALLLLVHLFRIPAFGQGTVIGFDQTEYFGRVGSPLTLTVELEAPVPEGLFSYGVKLVFDSARWPVTTRIGVPPELDFNGVRGPGAFREIDLGSAGVKGTIDGLNAALPYMGAWLAAFDLSYPAEGDYTVGLEIFNTLGPTESVFVTGTGRVLDNSIQFGSARIHIVPEPSTVQMLLWCGLSLALVPLLFKSQATNKAERASASRLCSSSLARIS